MAFGNFKETDENRETHEAKETTENIDRPRSQILKMPEKNEDDFDKKLEANESEKDSFASKSSEREKVGKEGGDKQNIFERMRDFFGNREGRQEKEAKNEKEEQMKAQDTVGKSWELSPEEFQKVREGQNRVAEKARNGEYSKSEEAQDGEDDTEDQRTPWGDAERRREHDRYER